MPESYLEKLIFNTTLTGSDQKVYKDCLIKRARIDPNNIRLGQTFVERHKYEKMIENLSDAFKGFCVNSGFAKCTPYIILGETKSGDIAIAHYVPPIVEEHGQGLLLLDGVHRNFLIRAVGTTIESIIIKRIAIPFPCDVHSWRHVKVVDAKPPKNDRFLNLKPELFRDLQWVGIDG